MKPMQIESIIDQEVRDHQPGDWESAWKLWHWHVAPPYPPGSEPVWWWDSESCSNSVFGETGRRLPDWWAFLVPGLGAEADGFPRHQEVRLSSNICPPSRILQIIYCFSAGSSSTQRRQHLLWNMTCQWWKIWPTESSYLREFHPSRPWPTGKSQVNHSVALFEQCHHDATTSLWFRRPESLSTGMCRFLQPLGISFRRDPVNSRPRINKPNSNKVRKDCDFLLRKRQHTLNFLLRLFQDREQKRTGNYFRPNEWKQAPVRLAFKEITDVKKTIWNPSICVLRYVCYPLMF